MSWAEVHRKNHRGGMKGTAKPAARLRGNPRTVAGAIRSVPGRRVWTRGSYPLAAEAALLARFINREVIRAARR